MYILKLATSCGVCLVLGLANMALAGELKWADRLHEIESGLIVPASAKANSALNIASKDQTQACIEATEAETLMQKAQAELKALKLESEASGDANDHEKIDLARFAMAVDSFTESRALICSGEFAHLEGAPETRRYVQLIGDPMKAYTDNMLEANAANTRGDKHFECQALWEAQNNLLELRINLGTLRDERLNADATVALDQFETRLNGFEDVTRERMKSCPISSE